MPVWIKISLVAGLLAALVSWHQYSKQSAVQIALRDQRAIYDLKVADEVQKAQETSIGLLNSALEDLQKKENEIKIISDKLSSLTHSLQQRTSRKDSANTPGDSSTCTGAELLREDGEFLAREAARADRILKERDFYYEQYKRAREAIAAHQGADG